MTYIQRFGQGQRETVAEFQTKREARLMLFEYRLCDYSACYYLSTRPCENWREEETEKTPAPVNA